MRRRGLKLGAPWHCSRWPRDSLWAFYLFLWLNFFPCTIVSGPLCHLWLSVCSCRPSTEEIINTILAIIVANSTAGGSHLIPLMAFLCSSSPNNSCNVMLQIMNSSETARHSISWAFRSCPHPSEAYETLTRPTWSPTRFG